ncbi:hypothetical protein ACN08N_26970 (plasmid) [Photobacterium leiognathi subsp. mandapamensis]|uniref:hypothetical protein n=1 Tax=Photobacterium leiognathi TaxID=553611 RepID=UPI003AF3DD7A
MKLKYGLITLFAFSGLSNATDYISEGTLLKDGSVKCITPSMEAGDTFQCGDSAPLLLERSVVNGKEAPTRGGDTVEYYNHSNDPDGGAAWREEMKLKEASRSIGRTTAKAPSGNTAVGSTPIWTSYHNTNVYNYNPFAISDAITTTIDVDGAKYTQTYNMSLNKNDDFYYRTSNKVAKTFLNHGQFKSKATTQVDGQSYKFVQDNGVIYVQ